MDISSEKLKLISWIVGLNDPILVKQLMEIKQENETNFWDDLTDVQKAHVEKGLSQAEAGLGKSLSEVNERLLKKYNLTK